METFADRVIRFNRNIRFTGTLPKGIRIMNPFREIPGAAATAAAFYHKYYGDNNKRHLVLGINPGRFGGGLTGIPFTDPKRLVDSCGITYKGAMAHEPSSAFIYEMIEAFGGPELFYGKMYINSLCPLGFTSQQPNGKEVNYNYYDSNELMEAVEKFIDQNVSKQIRMGVYTDTVFCFGTGKNEKYLQQLNQRRHYFGRIVSLEHPRFIMQYRAKNKKEYIRKYLDAFLSV